jgi:hypothetical protein
MRETAVVPLERASKSRLASSLSIFPYAARNDSFHAKMWDGSLAAAVIVIIVESVSVSLSSEELDVEELW